MFPSICLIHELDVLQLYSTHACPIARPRSVCRISYSLLCQAPRSLLPMSTLLNHDASIWRLLPQPVILLPTPTCVHKSSFSWTTALWNILLAYKLILALGSSRCSLKIALATGETAVLYLTILTSLYDTLATQASTIIFGGCRNQIRLRTGS